MDDLLAVAYLVVWLLMVALLGRLAFSVVASFARSWTPRGVALVVAEATYSATDPLVRPLRRLLPPVTLGGARLDLSLTVALVAVYFASILLR